MSTHSNMGHGSGYFEPELVYNFLPGCRNCGGSHPLARKPQMPADKCPDCGADIAPPGPERREAAALTGWAPSTLVARACLAIGKGLNNLAKRI